MIQRPDREYLKDVISVIIKTSNEIRDLIGQLDEEDCDNFVIEDKLRVKASRLEMEAGDLDFFFNPTDFNYFDLGDFDDLDY